MADSVNSKEAQSTDKYLIFSLGSEEYGLEILKVRDIIGMKNLTPIPHAPQYILGVMNLRGKIIPVMDLRKKLSLPAVADTKYTSIVVVHVEKLEMGLKVDTVSEVMDIERNAIEPSPDFGNQSHLDFVLGMGKTENGVRILLNISQILSSQEILDITELKNSDLN